MDHVNGIPCILQLYFAIPNQDIREWEENEMGIYFIESGQVLAASIY